MGADAPYLYTPSHASGPSFDFNPRAYTQSSYAASIQSQQRRSQPARQGPLIDLNRHPDSWMIVAPTRSEAEPLPSSFKTKIVVSRWIQFALRLMQLFGSLGIFVCSIMIKGTVGAETWVIKIPPAYDAFCCVYALYHLRRPAKARTPASSASYHFFALMMDGGLVPFYVFISMFSQANYSMAAGAEGRWRTFFSTDYATNMVLLTAYIAAAVVGGLHLLSLVLDILLIMWFKKITNMPPDLNPLEDNLTSRKTSKHKHKNSEMTASTISMNGNKFAMSGSTLHLDNPSTTSLAKEYSVPKPNANLVPWTHSRMGSDSTFSPHTLESARVSRNQVGSAASFYQQSASQQASRTHLLEPSNSRPNSRPSSRGPQSQRGTFVNAQHDPMPDRPSSFVSNRAYDRSSASPAPQSAIPISPQQQKQGLLNDNWYVMDDASDLGTPSRGTTPRPRSKDQPSPTKSSFASHAYEMPYPPIPPRSQRRQSGHEAEKENAHVATQAVDEEDIGRALTMGSSIYSEAVSDHNPVMSKTRFYGDLSAANVGVRGAGYGVTQMPMPMQARNGNERVVSRSGADVDGFELQDRGRRMASGKTAEEGRGGWEVRQRQVSGFS